MAPDRDILTDDLQKSIREDFATHESDNMLILLTIPNLQQLAFKDHSGFVMELLILSH